MRKTKNIQTRFPISLFIVLFIILLLMSGIHMGLIVLMDELLWNDWVQTMFPIVYWAAVALGVTMYTRYRMKKTYDIPMQILAEATAKVAKGDFSIYISPIHTSDNYDYLDIMFLDFNKMVAELGSIETLKTDFFSNVSHEIKTPLAVIQNNAELLQKDSLTDEQRMEYTETIRHATRRLSNLITNMLKLNKLEKQAIKPQPQLYDVCGQLCTCALQFEDVWDKKGIEFVAELDDCAMVEADEELMELVWTNLFSNAVKFTPNGGTITLTQTFDGNKIAISIADTGCGMDEETTRHIFDKFYQGDTSHSTEGNGLGLALVQRILQLSDGSITVNSTEGKGSVFTVQLPVSYGKEGLTQND